MSGGGATFAAFELRLSNAALATAKSSTRLSCRTNPTNSFPFASNVPSLNGVPLSPAPLAAVDTHAVATQASSPRTVIDVIELMMPLVSSSLLDARHAQRARNRIAGAELAPVRQHEVIDAATGLAVLVRVPDHGDHITGLDGVLRPAYALQHGDGGALERVGDRPALLVDGELDPHVRVGPLQFLHLALEAHGLRHVEHRKGMMCLHRRHTGEQHRGRQRGKLARSHLKGPGCSHRGTPRIGCPQASAHR